MLDLCREAHLLIMACQTTGQILSVDGAKTVDMLAWATVERMQNARSNHDIATRMAWHGECLTWSFGDNPRQML